MEFFRDTQFDFMKYRRFFMVFSVALSVVAILAIFVHGKLNLGIDFVGGTQLILRFDEKPEVEELRRIAAEAGIQDAQIQRFDEEEANTVIVKTSALEGSEEGSAAPLIEALNARFNSDAGGRPDLNRLGSDSLAALLLELDPDQLRAGDEATAGEHYAGLADAIVAVRRDGGLLTDWQQLEGVGGSGPELVPALRQSASLGSFAVLGAENVGPQIGAELRRKGILAVVLSLLGMLGYIWVRFELRFGIGAVVASTHDVLIVLGLYALTDYEFNLTTIAAFLTLVGYSVNDTVVVFDRVRENLRRRRRQPLVEVMNLSLNQTLSRTVLTSGTTLLTVGCLYVLGGDVLRGFGFILTLGIIVGTYSSVYIASPFAILWENLFGAEAKARRAGAG